MFLCYIDTFEGLSRNISLLHIFTARHRLIWFWQQYFDNKKILEVTVPRLITCMLAASWFPHKVDVDVILLKTSRLCLVVIAGYNTARTIRRHCWISNWGRQQVTGQLQGFVSTARPIRGELERHFDQSESTSGRLFRVKSGGIFPNNRSSCVM